MMKTTFSNHLDFDIVDRLPSCMAGRGRLATAAPAQPGQPSFLFVPGAFHGAWCYARYLEFFAAHGIGCAALDLPGHGLLPQTREFTLYTLQDFGLCVAQAIDAMDGAVVVVGHSMGAVPALLAASQRDVAGIVLLAPSPPANVPGAQALPAVPEGRNRMPPTPMEIRRRFAGTPDDFDVSPISARLSAESPEAMNDRYLLRVSVPPSSIAAPGLCIEAGRDDVARHPAGQDKAVADLYGFEHLLLPDMPHCMMYATDWEQSAEAILDWHQRQYVKA
jgi:pimeloyl-ACP methyl ester carboxylesterase